MNRSSDPALDRFRAALDEAYGARLSRVVLFGSRARGDARPASDYDIAVFIEGPTSVGAETGRIAAIGTDILLEIDAVINALPFAAGADDARTGFWAKSAATAVTFEAGGGRLPRQNAPRPGRRDGDRRIELATAAAQVAFYAAFHAAEAVIVERTGTVAKTHSGLRAKIADLSRTDPAIDTALQTFLGQAVVYKEISDSGVDREATVKPAEAQDAIAEAARLIERVTAMLMSPPA